jgi:hypothetical protein
VGGEEEGVEECATPAHGHPMSPRPRAATVALPAACRRHGVERGDQGEGSRERVRAAMDKVGGGRRCCGGLGIRSGVGALEREGGGAGRGQVAARCVREGGGGGVGWGRRALSGAAI